MYNLLVTSQEGAWDNDFYEFDKSRFLEYTNESIADAFKSLTPDNIHTLKTYPCLFAYEGDRFDVRIGNLTSIKERGRNLLVEFQIDDQIPPIPFADIEPIAVLLDIRSWEMNRTHWAVKDEDLHGRLISASLISPELVKTPGKQKKPTAQKSTKSKVASVQGFVGKVLSLEQEYDTEVFYRGHSDKQKYKLEPSLFRKDMDGNYLYLDNEHILYRELLVSNSSDFISDVYTLDRLVRMQHFSLPTRLLDITSNPLIALYFACKSNYDAEGEVVLFSMHREKVKYFDSDTASCIANLARMPKSEKDNIDFVIEGFNDQIPIKRLAHFIREEKPFFLTNIVPEDLRKIICVKGKQSNDRITSQSGALLLYGLDAVLDEKGTEDIKLNRITVANKEKIIKELDLLNINERTVFPYIENSAKYVANKYEFNKLNLTSVDTAST